MSRRPKSWFTVRNEAGAAAAELSIFDEIGAWGITARDFAAQLAAIPKDRLIDVLINSPGGSVWDALAIYNLLNDRRDKVTMKVQGIAASAASIVALAGSKTVMPRNAFMMVHNPAGSVWDGKSEDMRKYADLLDKVGDQLAAIYAAESGMDLEAAKELMDGETWLTADEAQEKGLCDEVTAPIVVTARFNLRRYSKVPQNLAGAGEEPANAPNKPISMTKIIAALLAAGITLPENATEDQIAAEINTGFSAIKTERDQLKTANQKHIDAQKKRVEARVKAAISSKMVKPEREASLIALGTADETNLDFLEDILDPAVAASHTGQQGGQRRGSPPVTRTGTAGADDTAQNIDNLRAELKEERDKGDGADPLRIANISRRLRELRGDKELFAPSK